MLTFGWLIKSRWATKWARAAPQKERFSRSAKGFKNVTPAQCVRARAIYESSAFYAAPDISPAWTSAGWKLCAAFIAVAAAEAETQTFAPLVVVKSIFGASAAAAQWKEQPASELSPPGPPPLGASAFHAETNEGGRAPLCYCLRSGITKNHNSQEKFPDLFGIWHQRNSIAFVRIG